MDQPISRWRQAGEGSQSQKGAIAAPERHPIPNCKQTLLLTKTSWDSGWSTSIGRVAARDQLPRRDTGTPEKACLLYTQKTEQLGWGRQSVATVGNCAPTWDRHKMQAQPSLCLCGVPENLNLSDLDLGSAYNPGPASNNSQQSNLEPEKYRP